MAATCEPDAAVFRTNIFGEEQQQFDRLSPTAPVTPPIYSPSYGSPQFYPHGGQQNPSSIASTGTLGQRSMSIQSLMSVGTTTTQESSLDDEKDYASVDQIEDPDVRMAAEALGELRADFIQAPPKEPLINLLGGEYPIIGHAMNAGRSVYRGGKYYSPRFKYGAEIVERAAGPMSTVVSFAARSTGVEGVIRRNLETSKKRRKTSRTVELEDEEDEDTNLTHKGTELVTADNWQKRLILNTAGVSMAFSEESLKSLKYCFDWLRWANNHLDGIIVALRSVLDEWDQQPGNALALQKRIDGLKGEVVMTIKRVVEVVSTYAGGALPENARLYVKACITSLPRRWANVANAEPSKALVVTTRETNRRVMLLAKEGLDMLHQVAAIVERTLNTAEEWCDRFGKRRPSDVHEYGKVGWQRETDGVEKLLQAAEKDEAARSQRETTTSMNETLDDGARTPVNEVREPELRKDQ